MPVSFLDEPLNSLDINYQHEFLQIAKEFTNNDTVLVAVMHDINLAIQYSDNLFFLKQGQLMAHGKPNEVLNAALIKDVFNVNATLINNPLSNNPLVIFG